MLFLTLLDCIMCKSTKQGKTAMQWSLILSFEDLDFCRRPVTHGPQASTHADWNRQMEVAARIGSRVSADKIELMKITTATTMPTTTAATAAAAAATTTTATRVHHRERKRTESSGQAYIPEHQRINRMWNRWGHQNPKGESKACLQHPTLV